MVASAECTRRSSDRMTWASHSRRPSSILPILVKWASRFLAWAGASSTCLPVYVIFMASSSVPDAPLVGGRDLHILAVFRHRAPRDGDPLGLQHRGDLLVRQRLGTVFFRNHFLHHPFQQEQRGGAAQRALHGFREEIAQLEHALRRMD